MSHTGVNALDQVLVRQAGEQIGMTRIDVIKHIKLLEALCTSLLISSDMAKHCAPVGSAVYVWYLWHLRYLLNYKKNR